MIGKFKFKVTTLGNKLTLNQDQINREEKKQSPLINTQLQPRNKWSSFLR